MINSSCADGVYQYPDHDLYIFICTNTRVQGKACGSESVCTEEIVNHLKSLVHAHKPKLKNTVKVKVNKSGCLGRCASGPNIVIFPDNVWYTYENLLDIEEIFNRHVLQGQMVIRLLNQKGK